MQFKYNTTVVPSAPFLDLDVESYFGKTLPEKGKIDTGSDGTVIPKYLVEKLELRQVNDVIVRGVQGVETTESTFAVYIKIGQTKFNLLEVTAMDRDNVLVGRDLINLWTLTLDGENKLGEIIPWSTNPNDVL